MTESAPRFRSPRPDDLPPEAARLYRAITGGPRAARADVTPIADDEGRLVGPFGPMLLAPGIGDAVQELGAAVRFRGALPDGARETAILTVAVAEGAGFEWFAHEGAARAAGVADRDIEAVRHGAEPADPALAAVWRVTHALATAGALDDDAYAEAERELGAAGIAELVWLTGHYAMLATALRVFDPPVPDAARGVFDDPDPEDSSG